MERYQGIVALDGDSLEEVAHTYFMQSEQIPTQVRLAVAEFTKKGDHRPHWRAGGVLVQHLPEHGSRSCRDLPGDGNFDNPTRPTPISSRPTGGTRPRSLLGTLDDDELADPDVSARAAAVPALSRDRRARVRARCRWWSAAPARPIASRKCCATTSPPKSAQDMAVDGEIEVVCEFCSTAYHFKPHQFVSHGFARRSGHRRAARAGPRTRPAVANPGIGAEIRPCAGRPRQR